VGRRYVGRRCVAFAVASRRPLSITHISEEINVINNRIITNYSAVGQGRDAALEVQNFGSGNALDVVVGEDFLQPLNPLQTATGGEANVHLVPPGDLEDVTTIQKLSVAVNPLHPERNS